MLSESPSKCNTLSENTAPLSSFSQRPSSRVAERWHGPWDPLGQPLKLEKFRVQSASLSVTQKTPDCTELGTQVSPAAPGLTSRASWNTVLLPASIRLQVKATGSKPDAGHRLDSAHSTLAIRGARLRRDPRSWPTATMVPTSLSSNGG